MILAIDTATRLMSLAVHDGFTVLAEQTRQAAKAHTEMLAPAITQILRDADASMDDITAIAAVVGPGSYTGVRIGVSMAKGLAAARQLPVVGINTLDALAAGQPKFDGALLAVVAAGRGRVITQAYRWNYARWVARGEPRLLKWDELVASIDGRVMLTGEITRKARDICTEAQATHPELKISFAPGAYSLRRAGFVAEVAWQQLNEAPPESFNAATLVPVYLNSLDGA